MPPSEFLFEKSFEKNCFTSFEILFFLSFNIHMLPFFLKPGGQDPSEFNGKVDETGDSFRFRQKNPENFKRFRTITLPNSGGVKAVIGIRKEIEKEIPICKIDHEKMQVFGIVQKADFEDAHEDVISEEELIKSSEFFMKSQIIGDSHQKESSAHLIENVVLEKGDVYKGIKIDKASWIIGIQINNKALWKRIKSGELNTFSPGGFGVRVPA